MDILIVCSFVVQFLTEQTKKLVNNKYPLQIALCWGLMLAWGTDIGLLETFGIPVKAVLIDTLITAIAYSSGGVLFNEIIKNLMTLRTK